MMRTRNALKVAVLIAGWDKTAEKPVLFWLDSIGSDGSN
jgi:20S proteasome alpha/beta subunit